MPAEARNVQWRLKQLGREVVAHEMSEHRFERTVRAKSDAAAERAK
jgi:hypothetical protein